MLPQYMNRDKRSKISRREREEREAFFRMNESFRKAQLFKNSCIHDEFYRQIYSYDVQLSKSVLIHILEEQTTVSGGLIRQDEMYCYFDIDYKNQEYTDWEEYEVSKLNYKPPQRTNVKPWDSNLLAIELFEILRSGEITTNFDYSSYLSLKSNLKRLT